jgi:hypothetical protein
MAGSAATSGLSVKVFVKKNEITPVRVFGITCVSAMTRPTGIAIGQEKVTQATRKFPGDCVEC